MKCSLIVYFICNWRSSRNHKSQITRTKEKITNLKLQEPKKKSQISNHKNQRRNHKSQITRTKEKNHKSQITRTKGEFLRHYCWFLNCILFGSWVLDLGFLVLDLGFWILDLGFLDFGSWVLDLGFLVLDLGSWVLGFGFWVFPSTGEQRYAVQVCDATKAPASGPGLRS